MGALYRKLNTQSSAPEEGQNNFPKHAELTGIINKPLLFHLVGCLKKLNSVALVRERTIPTERPPPVGEVSANFCG